MELGDILERNCFRFSKRYGQNFITDGNLLSAIASDAGVESGDTVVEVGAGAGTLTAALAARAKRVVAFEIDETLRPVLKETVGDLTNVEIVFADVLKAGDPAEYLGLEKRFKLVANLPYYVTTPVLFRFLYEPGLVSLTVMVQKEVAERMCAAPGTSAYGALSAQLAAMGRATLTRHVSRRLFRPEPKVDSAVVRLDIAPVCPDGLLPALRRVIAVCFAMRRKTLLNNLSAGYSLTRPQASAVLESADVDGGARGETLDIAAFTRLAQALQDCNIPEI